jgi:CHAD domain-containing protein
MRRIAAGRTQKAIEELRSAAGGEEPARSIHATRKDLKKLRSLLRLVRGELGESLYKSENERYREVGRSLSATRDAQVKAETLRSLLEHSEIEPAVERAAARWERRLEQEDRRAGEETRNRRESMIAPLLEQLQEGEGQIADWPLDENSWSLVDAGLTRAYRRGRRAMRQAAADSDPDAVHEWRKRAKDLRYQLQILRVVRPRRMEEAANQARRLSDLLGDHHDLTALSEDLRNRRLARSERAVLEATIAARRHELLEEALDLGKRTYAEKPKAFRKRIRGYWRASGRPAG